MPSSGGLCDPGMEPACLLHWQVDSLPLAPPGKPSFPLGLLKLYKVFFFFFNIYIYFIIFICAGLPCCTQAFLQLWQAGATLQLWCVGFSLQWLLLCFCSGKAQTLGTQVQQLQHVGLVALQHVESSQQSSVKNLPANAGDFDLIRGLGRFHIPLGLYLNNFSSQGWCLFRIMFHQELCLVILSFLQHLLAKILL